MNNYILQTEDRTMRPVTLDDAEFIVKLRNQNHTKGNIHETSLDVEKQRQWIIDYFGRENEYYWIIEDLKGYPIGTNSFYNYNSENNHIEQGRWVQMADLDGVISLSSEIVMKDFAFYVLGVSSVDGEVVSTNKKVVKYNKFIGTKEKDRIIINELGKEPVVSICFEMTEELWKDNRKRLLKFCTAESAIKIFKQLETGEIIEVNYKDKYRL